MAVVFSMRGSTTAIYSGGGATAALFGSTAPTTAADTTAPTGNVIIWAASGNAKGAVWPGRFNLPNSRTIAVNICIRHGYTGTPAASHNWWALIAGAGKLANLEIGQNSAGNIVCQAKNESANLISNSSPWGTYSASSTGFTDITFNWDGNTNPMRLHVNGTAYGTAITPTASFAAGWNNQYFSEICLGTGNMGGVINGGKVAEFTVWDTTIDVTAVPLTDNTTATLNGSRTAPITVAALNGMAWTTLAQTNVRNAIVYTAAGVGLTGSVVLPAQALVISGTSVDNSTGTYVTATTTNVKNAVLFGPLSSLTGSYTGSDRWSDPGLAHVEFGVNYTVDSVSTTGSLVTGSGGTPQLGGRGME